MGLQPPNPFAGWSNQPSASRGSSPAFTGEERDYIRVLETSALKERRYALIITSTAICGANLSGAAGPSLSNLLADPLGQKACWEQEGRLADYRAIDPLSQAFLQADAENFRIQRHELQKITILEQYHTYRGDQRVSGRVTFHLQDRSQRSFILLGDQNVFQLAALLRLLTANAEVVSKNPIN